jgi:hypothetical protein
MKTCEEAHAYDEQRKSEKNVSRFFFPAYNDNDRLAMKHFPKNCRPSSTSEVREHLNKRVVSTVLDDLYLGFPSPGDVLPLSWFLLSL